MSHDMSEKTESWKKSARYSLHASPKNKREKRERVVSAEATESWKPFMGLKGKIGNLFTGKRFKTVRNHF